MKLTGGGQRGVFPGINSEWNNRIEEQNNSRQLLLAQDHKNLFQRPIFHVASHR